MSKHISTSQRDETFEQDIRRLQSDFIQLLTSGCHYLTQELTNQIKHINNALDNIKLDHEFQSGSKHWIKQFDATKVQQNETSVKQLIGHGRDLAQQLNTCLHTSVVQNKEENQLRELNSWARNSLLGYLQALHPFASDSYARLDNMAHHLGVTDRYIGYRHNLSRGGSQPLDVHSVWADRKLPRVQTAVGQHQSTPDWKNWAHSFRHYGPSASTHEPLQSVQRSSSMNDQGRLLGYMRTEKQPQQAEFKRPSTTPYMTSRSNYEQNDHETIARKAGINLTYPGQTEFMDRYKKPEVYAYSPFTINPQPDYTLPGRPLTRLIPDSVCSEYSRSYVFPEASKIERFPWLRYW